MAETAIDLGLRAHLKEIRDRGDKALGLFLTSGFPEPEATLPLLHALDESGADFLELGMPFSDPLAEGLPIQRASERALRHGTTMADTLATARSFCASSTTPLVLMGYVNPILRYGVRAFCEDAAACGVSGLILPDLPPQEADLVAKAAAESGLALTFLIAPNTPDARVRLVDSVTTGFVYAVSQAGVTGGSIDRRDAVFQYLERARSLLHNNPLLVGFGIRTPADVAALSAAADGCIVGSAIIDRASALWDDSRLTTPERLDAIGCYVRSLKDASRHLSE